jgi:hypothetical protein
VAAFAREFCRYLTYKTWEGCSAAACFFAFLRLSTELRRVRARSLAWSIFFQKPTK